MIDVLNWLCYRLQLLILHGLSGNGLSRPKRKRVKEAVVAKA